MGKVTSGSVGESGTRPLPPLPRLPSFVLRLRQVPSGTSLSSAPARQHKAKHCRYSPSSPKYDLRPSMMPLAAG